MKRILLYPGWLRTWHWLNAALFIVLIWTGVEVHFAKPGTPGLGFQRSHALHNVSGILLTLGYVLLVLGNLMTSNGKHYRLSLEDVRRGLARQLRYYLWGIFRGEPHPYQHGEKQKFNPLQKVSYSIIMYIVLPLMMLTGWVILFPDKIPKNVLGIDGRLFYGLAHTFGGYLLGLFMMVHIYLGTTGTTPLALYKGILTGWVAAHDETAKK
jgi:thiosulfate reductase cytochrome b subunit